MSTDGLHLYAVSLSLFSDFSQIGGFRYGTMLKVESLCCVKCMGVINGFLLYAETASRYVDENPFCIG